MPGIGIIVNPHSRGHRLDPSRAERLGFIVGEKGSCHTTNDLLDVEQLAKEFKERKIDILGISGGDGTNHKTLTTFINVYGSEPLPKIALLRGGTMNNTANYLNIRGAPETILSNLILKYHEDIEFKEKPINLLRVNNSYGFLFGMGVVSRFINIYNSQESKKRTPWGALKLLTSCVIGGLFGTKAAYALNERFDAKITVDGIPAPFKNYTMIFSGTIDNLGLHFRPLYRTNKTPGMFQFVGISTTPRKFVASLPSAFFARPSASEDYFDAVGSRIVIEMDKPMDYMIDGDASEASDSIEISTGPALNMIVL